MEVFFLRSRKLYLSSDLTLQVYCLSVVLLFQDYAQDLERLQFELNLKYNLVTISLNLPLVAKKLLAGNLYP